MWATLLLMVITAGLTYWVAPKINSNFEKERRRSELILSQTKDINASTKEILGLTATLLRDETNEKRNRTANELLRNLTSLQWQVLEIRSMPKNDDFKGHLDDYSDAIIELGKETRQFIKSEDYSDFESAAAKFAVETAELNSAMYTAATD